MSFEVNSSTSDEQRAQAPELYRTLESVGKELQNGRRNFAEMETAATQRLADAGFDVEYFAIRRALNLEVPDRDCDDLVVLVAAQMGEARLIDNVVVTV